MSHTEHSHSTQSAAPKLVILTIILFLALIAYDYFIVKAVNENISIFNIITSVFNMDIANLKTEFNNDKTITSYINLYIPSIFLSLSIFFSILFLLIRQLTGKNILYYLFLISITALSLSFIEIHRETAEMVKNIKDIDNFKLILIKSISILIPAIAFVTNYFSATLINLFKRNNQA